MSIFIVFIRLCRTMHFSCSTKRSVGYVHKGPTVALSTVREVLAFCGYPWALMLGLEISVILCLG